MSNYNYTACSDEELKKIETIKNTIEEYHACTLQIKQTINNSEKQDKETLLSLQFLQNHFDSL